MISPAAYRSRVQQYDDAWKDQRGIGWPQSMIGRFAELCVVADPASIPHQLLDSAGSVFLDLIPLWDLAFSLSISLTADMKSSRLADG